MRIILSFIFIVVSIAASAQLRTDVYHYSPNAELITDTLEVCQTTNSFKAYLIDETTNDTIKNADFLWEFSNYTAQTEDSVAIDFSEGDAFVAKLTITAGTETHVTFIPIEISIRPYFTESEISADQAICLGDKVNLSGKITTRPFELKQDSIKSLNAPANIISDQATTLSFLVEAFPNDLIFSPDLLDSVILKMEHESSADLSIQLICPSGNTILLKSNDGTNAYMGEPVDVVSDNTLGETYWYYWSPSATLGTMTAEAGNYQHSYTDNSGNDYTDVEYLPSNTYTPVEDFSGLNGCPVNGTWKFVITDHESNDKTGYITAYGLDFDHEKLTEWYFENTYGALSGIWDGDGISGTSSLGAASAEPTDYGWAQYTYIVTDNFGCKYDTILSALVAKPTFDADPASGEAPLIVNFSNTTDWATAFSWDLLPDFGLESSEENPSFTYTEKNVYNVLFYATSAQGCEDVSDTLKIEVTVPPSEIKEIPNVFTPNNDGINDLFVVETVAMESALMYIYNRNGDKIASFDALEDEKFSWDGTAGNDGKGTVSQSTYFYHIEAIGIDGVKHKKKGFIMVFYGK